jgi:hypothetical protein
MTIPKTPKGLSNRISKIRSQFSAIKKEYGFINDGSGSRYYLFYLYFLLDDNRRSSEFLQWFEKEFPNDIGEPFQLLCWTLILHRQGKNANYQLARTMLFNIYIIPHILGEDLDRVDMWHSSNYSEPDYVEYLPVQVREAITEEDLEWIQDKYNSEPSQKVLKRHIAIKHELQTAPVGEKRSALVQEDFSLLDEFR